MIIVRIVLGIALTLLPLRAELDLLKRPVIIGASLSDGFYLPELGLPFRSPVSKQLGMDRYLEQTRGGGGERILNLGTNWMFVAPEVNGIYQVKKAREAQPTVVFAVDFLFWYLYGNPRSRSEEDRALDKLEFFEKGLAHLGTFDCPVIVGNIPDARKSVGLVLSKAQYPGKEVIEAANKRLGEWLKEHPKVVKVDLAGFHSKASNNEEISVAGKVIPAGQTRRAFLQTDLLHPTVAGVSAIVEASVEAVKAPER